MKQLAAVVFAWWFLYQPIGTSGKYLAGPFHTLEQCVTVNNAMVYTQDCFED